jgi:hypothetical protein
MDETPDEQRAADNGPLPPDLRFLKGLVTVLTLVMIAGVIAIVALLVIRLNAAPPAPIVIDPGDFALPTGVSVTGIGTVGRRVVIVGDDGIIRVHDADTGEAVETFTLAE